MEQNRGNRIRKWFRIIHADLSYFFSGVILVYAVSGFLLNHKNDFNAEYSIKQYEIKYDGSVPIAQTELNKAKVLQLLEPYGEAKNYTQHYFPDSLSMKVFLKGGSSLEMDLTTGIGLLESVKKRPLFSGLNRLHYNPNKWWTLFSDIFLLGMVVLTFTGIFMLKGKRGLWGRGGIELLIGILIPLLFMFLIK